MYHFFEAITNTSGDSLVGFRVALRTADNAVVPIYADQNGTPIAAVSRIDNVALTNAQGNVSLFVEQGTYDILISGPDGTLYETIRAASFATGEQGEPGKDAPLAQVASGTTIAGQTRFPASGPIIDIKGAQFNETISVVDVSLNGAILAPGVDYAYDGGSTGIFFTSAQPAGVVVVVIGQPQIATGGGGGVLGSDEVDVASYLGTSITDDPMRFDHDGERFKNAQIDVTNPNSPNYRKAVRFFPGGGSGQLVLQDRNGNNVPQLTAANDPADPNMNAKVGDWLLDSWSQNGKFEPNDSSGVLVDNKNDPGNWLPGVVIRAPGCRFRRAPRYHMRPYILCADPAPTAATTVNGIDTQQDVYVGNRIEGYPAMIGENHWRGYSQHANDVQVNAVTDFYAELVGYGSRSDVLYIGAGSVGGGSINRHNKRVKYHVIADGYNTNNRNVVSTIDVDGEEGKIWARRFCKPGGAAANDDMDPNTGVGAPGAHDAEPNASFTDNPIYRNSFVEIYAEDCGSPGALFLPENGSFPNPCRNIRRLVTHRRCGHGFISQTKPNPVVSYAIEVDITCDHSDRAFEVLAGGGVFRVHAEDCPKTSFVGYFGLTSGDFHLSGDMIRTGTASGVVIENRGWDGGSIKGLRILGSPNCIGIRNLPKDNAAQITRNLAIDGIEFGAGMVNGFYTDTTHDLRPGTIREANVVMNGNTNFAWPVVGSTVRSIPGAGQYRQGDTLTISGEPGSPRTIMALTTNAAGTAPTFGVQDYIQPTPPAVDTGNNATFNVYTSTGIQNAPSGNLIATALEARLVRGSSVSEFVFRVKAPSGSAGIYVGAATVPNPTSFMQIYIGAWIGDQTGGVGRVAGVIQGANSGTPQTFSNSDVIVVSGASNNAAQVSIERAGGGTVQVLSTGLPNVTLYPVILMRIAGEKLVVLNLS